MFLAIAFQLCFKICHQQCLVKTGRLGTHHLLVYADDVIILRGRVHTIEKNTDA
jgi:hypothetical protein